MEIRKEYLGMSGNDVWNIVVDYVRKHGSFTSVTGIRYSATFVGSCIFVKGGSPGTKRADKGEYLILPAVLPYQSRGESKSVYRLKLCSDTEYRSRKHMDLVVDYETPSSLSEE